MLKYYLAQQLFHTTVTSCPAHIGMRQQNPYQPTTYVKLGLDMKATTLALKVLVLSLQIMTLYVKASPRDLRPNRMQ